MKTENVQRQNIIELKKEKCLEGKRIQNEQTLTDKSTKKDISTARKSTNPIKLMRNQESKPNSPSSSKDEETGASGDLEVLDDAVPQGVRGEESEPVPKKQSSGEQSTVTSLPVSESNETDGKEQSNKENKEGENKGIEKVWENIRKDLIFSEDEEEILEPKENNDNEEEFEDISMETPIPIEKPEDLEEEEPPDWEERDHSDGEIENQKPDTSEGEEVNSGECVLILSDEEGEETEEILSTEDNGKNSTNLIQDAACKDAPCISLDASKEIQDDPVLLSEDGPNKIDKDTLQKEESCSKKTVGEESKENESIEKIDDVQNKGNESIKEIVDDAESKENESVEEIADVVEKKANESREAVVDDAENKETENIEDIIDAAENKETEDPEEMADNAANKENENTEEIMQDGETKETENTEEKIASSQKDEKQTQEESELNTDDEHLSNSELNETTEDTKGENLDSAEDPLNKTAKVKIKRNLSAGDDENCEQKKIKLDDTSLNCDEDSMHSFQNGENDCSMDISAVSKSDYDMDISSMSKSTILTHKALEDMIAQEICEYMMEGSKNCILTWKKKYQELEGVIDTWKKKAENLQQQLAELQVEQKKLMSVGTRSSSNLKKATRTVGINVRLPQELLTRTVGTNVNLPQRPLDRLPKILNASKGIQKVTTRSDGTVISSAGISQEKSGVQPVPMQLIANSALGPSKSTSTTTSTTVKPVGSSISFIDLTREDGESAASSGVLTTGTSLASLAGGNVVMSSATTPRTITLTPNQNSNVVAVPLVCTTLSSMMPFLPTTPTASSTSIRTSQPSGAVVSSTLNQGARLTYLVPQTPITVNPAIRPGTGTQNSVTNPKTPMQAIFLRMSSSPATTSRYPVQSTIATAGSQGLNVVPSPRSSVTSSMMSQRPIQTVVVSNMSASSATAMPAITTTAATDINQLTSANKTNMVTKQGTTAGGPGTVMISCIAKHPAPLPSHHSNPDNPNYKALPPKPALKISRVTNGIVLSWNMILNTNHAEVSSYQLYAYQEGNGPPSTSLWKKVGDVKALPLPMACTLTQFVEGHTYHFAVRAIDAHSRLGPFSDPTSIVLVGRSTSNK